MFAQSWTPAIYKKYRITFFKTFAPISTNQSKLQVRSSDGSRLVVKLNQSHTVADLKQEILSRQETREGRTSFALISVGKCKTFS